MTGEDLTSARLAPPPREPLGDLTADQLIDLGHRIHVGELPNWFWGEGVCLLGMIRFAQAAGQPFPSAVLEYLDRYVESGVTVEHVNNLAPGTAAVLAAQATGDNRYLKLVEPLADWLATQPAGVWEHWPGSVWADTVCMGGVFLGHLGAATGNSGLVAEFGRQLVAHADVLQHPETGLFAHGSHHGETIWSYWGRANAWTALAAVEYLELGAESQVDFVRDSVRRQLVALAGCQPAHGVWDVLVDGQPECRGTLETSAAAGIGAAMLRAGAVVPDLPATVTEAGQRAVRGALSYVDEDGVLTRVSAGTVLQLIPFGYSVIRDDREQLWGQGLALHAVAAALTALAAT